ncbi:MAG: ATP phosphoribosyltransferase regulatory subunit, partial [Rhodospirillales bacterium]|nr:ATP phosphoribosyltransferase regulatory subunit [Rhodospirillales bacterium]
RRLADVVGLIRQAAPDLALSADPVENRNFEYHRGLCFTLFADRAQGELGRGGLYLAGEDLQVGQGEPATGFTLFMDSILRVLPPPAPPRRLFIPYGASIAAGVKSRAEGWATVAGLAPVSDPAAEARRLLCSHVLVSGAPQKVS